MEKCKECNGTRRYKWEPDDLIPDEECAACHGTSEVEKQPELHEINYR